MTDKWLNLERPGYFGRKRDEKVAKLNEKYGAGWRLVWEVLIDGKPIRSLEFEQACMAFYEHSYLLYLSGKPEEVDFACSFGECIDNAMTNIESGLDYTKQESYSTHIQDIALRNALRLLGRKFEGPKDKILVIRSKDSSGFRFGPGNVPFYDRQLITQPSMCPRWANLGSVEDFWQSNKWIQVKDPAQ